MAKRDVAFISGIVCGCQLTDRRQSEIFGGPKPACCHCKRPGAGLQAHRSGRGGLRSGCAGTGTDPSSATGASAETEVACLFISHDLAVVREIADTLHVIKNRSLKAMLPTIYSSRQTCLPFQVAALTYPVALYS